MDIQWELISGNVYDDTIQTYLKHCSLNEGEITTIALCFESSELNASVCLALPVEICKTANQILVRQKESETTVSLIQKLPYRDCVKPFGMMSECYNENLISNKYGKLINALYSRISNLSETDKIQQAWDTCSITDKWSSIYCANMIYTRLRSLGLSIDKLNKEDLNAMLANSDIQDDIQATEHNRWNTEKLLLGFSSLSDEEQSEFRKLLSDKTVLKQKKKGLAKSDMKHLDICSNEVLKEIDPDIVRYDNDVNDKLWELHCIISNTK